MRGTVTKKHERWYICYYIGKDSGGKWKQKWEGSWETKREAERVLRSRIEDIENSYDRKVESASIAEFLHHWLKEYCEPRLAVNTVKGYTVNIEKHIIPYIGKIPLNKIQPKDIQQLYASLRGAGLSGTSSRYVHNNLHKAFNYAVKAQLIPRNPADYVEAPRVSRYEASVLTPEQVRTLIRASYDDEIYIPVLLAVSLGLRRGEALGLQWRDVDLTGKTVTIAHSAYFDKDGIHLSTTKTKNSRRTLLMPDVLQKALEAEHLRQQEHKGLSNDLFNPLGLVCCRSDGQPFTTNALQHQFSELLAERGLPHIRFHDLRHTNATMMLRSSVPAKIVSSMLGHSSIGITLDTYSHVITEMQENAVTVMDALLQD